MISNGVPLLVRRETLYYSTGAMSVVQLTLLKYIEVREYEFSDLFDDKELTLVEIKRRATLLLNIEKLFLS
jgi:hypothetical protein